MVWAKAQQRLSLMADVKKHFLLYFYTSLKKHYYLKMGKKPKH